MTMQFPKGFLWGAATSAHVVEGEDYQSDWWRWEQRPGRILDNSTSQKAAGHFARLGPDAELLSQFGFKAHLFSLSWGRIEPGPGQFDADVLGHYASFLRQLDRSHIVPVIALQHVSLPAWFAADGGWRQQEAPTLFERYAAQVLDVLGPYCQWWIPILDPFHVLRKGMLEGVWPPGRKSFRSALRPLRNMLEAHGRVYRFVRRVDGQARVGPAIAYQQVVPADRRSPWDLRAARLAQYLSNRLVPEAVILGKGHPLLRLPKEIRGSADFIGFSYYGLDTARFRLTRPRQLFMETSGKRPAGSDLLSPAIFPRGLRDAAAALARYRLPLLVTGNGLAATDDSARRRYLLDHLAALRGALSLGADVRGYFYYSFLDGFEWTAGYTQRYGLFHVDRETLSRTPNGAAFLFKDICEKGALRPGTLARFCPDWQPPADMEMD